MLRIVIFIFGIKLSLYFISISVKYLLICFYIYMCVCERGIHLRESQIKLWATMSLKPTPNTLHYIYFFEIFICDFTWYKKIIYILREIFDQSKRNIMKAVIIADIQCLLRNVRLITVMWTLRKCFFTILVNKKYFFAVQIISR